jgi:hypothetical protein
MHSRRARNRFSEHGWSSVEILASVAVIFGMITALIWVVIPFDRYREARNARRSTECYSLLNAILLRETDDRARFYGETYAPIDRDPVTAQIIARTIDDASCAPGDADTPTCPGAAAAGLTMPDRGWSCLTLLDDGRINKEGLVNRYLLSLPIDPAGSTANPLRYIQGLPLGNNNTGYYVNRGEGGRLEVGACHPEMGVLIREKR